MKLRLTHNSVRIRIRKSELEELARGANLMESIEMPDGHGFQFGLTTEDIEKIGVTIKDHTLTVSLPKKEANNWIKTDQVGIEKELSLKNDQRLHVLIEKDFPCKDREGEDKSDTFWELAQSNDELC